MAYRTFRPVPNRANRRSGVDELQPYFRAFLLHTGADPEQASNTEYTLWISRKWQEWREAHGIGRWALIGVAERRRFERWLFETVQEGQLTLF